MRSDRPDQYWEAVLRLINERRAGYCYVSRGDDPVEVPTDDQYPLDLAHSAQ